MLIKTTLSIFHAPWLPSPSNRKTYALLKHALHIVTPRTRQGLQREAAATAAAAIATESAAAAKYINIINKGAGKLERLYKGENYKP